MSKLNLVDYIVLSFFKLYITVFINRFYIVNLLRFSYIYFNVLKL